ncbi:MAG: DNA gyrase subunit A [Candidatus Thermoplasmatota archaeon]|nr:DNA gyrase subunit A [Candidatus Thermoplasmatota archaeon]
MSDEEQSKNPVDNQVRHSIDKEMQTSYINYAMSVIIGRALPDVRDGLKPVHRRVLFGMYEAGHTHERGYSKSARSVGEVMGKYHPHGDQSIYDTMVRMAQDFSLRYPLVDGQGNFGSIDGDPPAAMRYTESRLDRLSSHMLDDIKKETVEFQPNFDDSEQEPTVLPARLPNLLLNGSDGIAVGMATRIPPHNLREVTAAVNLHVSRILEDIEDGASESMVPKISVQEYMGVLSGPDFPTGATIHGIDGIHDMYATGHGRFHIRSRCEVHDDDKGKKIIVTEIPYQVKKSLMLEGIADLVQREVVVGIRDIRDESSKEGIRVVIEVKNNADPHAVLNQLYQSSRLQESYSANMMGIIDGRPIQLDLRTILQTYVRHRESVIERRTQFDLNKAQARAHILEGLVLAQARIDDIVRISRNSESREQFERILRGEETPAGTAAFSFSERQAKAIAERRLYQLTKLNVQEVDDELDVLMKAIAEFEIILGSRPKRLEILLTELDEATERHGDDRRTEIDPSPLSMDREDLIEERAIVITLTNDNYIRHLPAETFRMQNRGGKGMKGVQTKNEDFPINLSTCFSKDRLLIFTNRPSIKSDGTPYIEGRVYGLKAWETPRGSRTSRGGHIRNILGLKDDENVVSIIPMKKELIEDPTDHYLAFATRNGVIKKSQLSDYVKINKNGKKAINLSEDDELVTVREGTDESHVVMVSTNGRACRFTLDSVRSQGRVSSGVRGIDLDEGANLAGMILASEFSETHVLTLTRQGMGKRTLLGTGAMIDESGNEVASAEEGGERDGYRITSRGKKGVNTMRLNEGDEVSRVHQVPNLSDQLFLLSGKGVVIRVNAGQTKETKGRVSKGTRVMELRSKDKSEFVDELIFSARMPAELVDEILTEKALDNEEE